MNQTEYFADLELRSDSLKYISFLPVMACSLQKEIVTGILKYSVRITFV